jgi:dienelactone hydrolase
MKNATRFFLSFVIFSCLSAGALAQDVTNASVTFPGAKVLGFPYTENVTAELRLPKAAGKVPAVVILHGSGGIDGRGAFYAEALNRNGIATLEVYMFDRGQRPSTGPRTHFTHVYGALRYLAQRPEIIPTSIGVMGFSWGGALSLMSASKPLTETFMADAGGLQFAAHAPFYPVCWTQLRRVTNPRSEAYEHYKAFTGAPVLLSYGGRDDYDASPQDCNEFVAALSKRDARHITLQFYPEATHAWDGPYPAPRQFQDRYAHGGQGGTVHLRPDAKIAAQSRAKTIEFFVRILKARG